VTCERRSGHRREQDRGGDRGRDAGPRRACCGCHAL